MSRKAVKSGVVGVTPGANVVEVVALKILERYVEVWVTGNIKDAEARKTARV